MFFLSLYCYGHGEAHYLGNSAVVVKSKGHKILYDPFFHNNFGIYQLVPEDLQKKVMAGEAPYDNVDAIFISHAHEDHFDKQDVLEYLKTHESTLLFAPKQAVDMILSISGSESVSSRMHAISLDFGDPAITKSVDGISADAVRIPHAGWPGRKDVENIVFRVTIDEVTTMHMGDADPDDDHYLPFKSHWTKRKTNMNFPPFWFFMSAEGRDILNEIINAEEHVGVHVPMQLPKYLQQNNKPYFSVPSEMKIIE